VTHQRTLERRTFLHLTLVALAAPACGRTKSEDARRRIALIMKSLANEFFLTMERGARDHQAKHADHYELIATGIKDELDVNAQVGLMEQMIARQVNAIVLAPADSKALVSACKRALDARIVVVNIDNRLDADALAERNLRIPFVGPDNWKGARMAAAEVTRALDAGAPVAILEGVPTAINGIQRRLGFEDAIRERGLKIVASQPADWDTARANQVAAAMLTEHPALKAIFCANDNMALGAVAAIRAAGREGQVLVVGFDNISAVQELVKAGRIAATADQHAGDLAVFGIEYALEILSSGATPADRETPVDLVTPTTLQS
jgi:ribose transport system substrate-binding protein